MRALVTVLIVFSVAPYLGAQTNRIDLVRADAPELAHFGDFAIGVRTVAFTAAERPDVLNTLADDSIAYYDRSLTVEIWYPATLDADQSPGGRYRSTTRNTAVEATLFGSAVRDADVASAADAFPLVIISHGYPGNRYLLSHLGENLASKGYVVAAIDHRDSTYTDQQAFASTLYNRAPDQRFVIDSIARMAGEPGSFLYRRVAAGNTAVVGFSMGGYGLLNNLGAGYNPAVVNLPIAPPNGLLAEHTTLNESFRDNLDSRIRAGVAIAPWGMNNSMWRPEDLEGIRLPVLYVAGSVDTTAGYDNGTRAIFKATRNSDRLLLTFENAGHSAGAPIPVPVELLTAGDGVGVSHYIDPVWDTLRMNNIMDHFITAFLDLHLKGDEDRRRFLQLPERSEAGWTGFTAGPAIGLRLEHLAPGQPDP